MSRERLLLVLGLMLVLSSSAAGQAEPAPPDYVPPPRPFALQPEPLTPPTAALPKWHLSLDGRVAVLLGSRTLGLGRVGYGAGVEVSRAVVFFGPVRLSPGLAFGYQRFKENLDPNLFEPPFQRTLSHVTFIARGVFDALFGRLRPFLGLGVGLSVITFMEPPLITSLMGVDVVTVVPLLQVATGLDILVYRGIELGLHGEFDFTFSSQKVGPMQAQPFASGFFAAGVALGFRF